VVEAWIVLVTWVVTAVGATVAGLLVFLQVDDSAQRQQEQRRPVQAVVLRDVHTPAAGALYVSPSGDRARAPVSWHAPDGTVHTGTTYVHAGAQAGERVPAWVGPNGHLAEKPTSPAMVSVQSALAGSLAAGGASLVLLTGRRVAVSRLDRRRAADWDRGLAELGLGHGPRTP
jgi:hypothetical protein